MKRRPSRGTAAALAVPLLLGACVGLSERNLPEAAPAASDVAVFGLAMLKPFGGMSECRFLMGEYNAARPRNSRCFERPPALAGTGRPLGTESIRVVLAGQEIQQLGYLYRGELNVGLVHGVVHSVVARTGGVRSQWGDLAEVRAMLGRRCAASETYLEGAKVLNCLWQFDGVQVTFSGAEQVHPGLGVIRAQSSVWQALQERRPATHRRALDT